MVDEHDELTERVARALKPLPPLDARAAARIVTVVRARRARAPGPFSGLMEWIRVPTFSVASAGLLAAAALAIGFMTRGALSSAGVPAPDASSVTSLPLVPAANAPDAAREVPTPLTFEAPRARAVSVVGDFNDWDASASPMTRFGANGPWTATVKATPGRHLYAFMVDGNLVADPRAPHTRDLDYGGDASVMMVNAP